MAPPALAALLAALLGVACGDASANGSSTGTQTEGAGAEDPGAAEAEHRVYDPYELVPPDKPVSDDARALMVDLIDKLRPLDPTLTSDHHDRWFQRNKALVEELQEREPEVGWAALHAFTNFHERDYAIRRTLLQIGARCAPEEARPLLLELAFTYGYHIEDRTEALLMLAETSPEVFLERAEPYLRRRGRLHETVPNDEFFAAGWVTACERTGRSPVPVMSDVATNLMMEHYARVIALRALGAAETTPESRAALETVLVESSGNGYLRRVAAQNILAAYPQEDACDLFRLVLSREADPNMARFLDNMIQENCRR